MSLNIIYKYNKFLKTLLKKDFKFVLNNRNNSILFLLHLMLMLYKIDLILKKQSCKKTCLGLIALVILK